ncbi:MAG: hypothetical protein R3F48_00090 [Candidatus Zixiibacteriota bacterium]
MPDEIYEDQIQQRINRKRVIIESSDGALQSDQDEVIMIAPNGSVLSITNHKSFELNGEIIHNVKQQIIGRCQIADCRQYLTHRTQRICSEPNCNIILCDNCAKYDPKSNRYFCKKCLKKIKRKRIALITLRIVLSPFVERVR